ncbi:TonB-dependent receptor domain-containing protein, partial [Streptomyces scabiei]|uniref:TonB-dependent receptor domain-containing protein n=2 Tax=Bacteria TaxID=2 RepID=UPI0038F5DFE1
DNAVAVIGAPRQVRYADSKWSWTAGVNYDFTRTVGVFGRYSRGNSFPAFDNLREGLTIVAQVDTYEGGLKVSLPWVSL